MSLATIKVDNVTEDKFAAIQQSADKEFKAHYTQATVGGVTAGTLQDHGSTIAYSYDKSKTELTLDIVSIGRVWFKKPSTEEVKQALIGWIEEVIANMQKNPVDETVPKSDTVIPMSTAVKASDVPPATVNEPMTTTTEVTGVSTNPTANSVVTQPTQPAQPIQPVQFVPKPVEVTK